MKSSGGRSFISKIAIGAVASTTTFVATPAAAQEEQAAQSDQLTQADAQDEQAVPSDQADQTEPAEIIITARRREESYLEVPESISVISETSIERGRIQGLEDIGRMVPNLTLSTRADGLPNVSIRGIGSFGNTQGVGFYLDDVQLFADASSRFGDLERIEVLRGPQGTLYGGSNIGGAVKFVSVRPDSDAFSGRVTGTIGEQNIRDVEALLNVPFGQSGWAMRLFAFSASDDGFLINTNPPRLNGLRGTNDPDVGAVQEKGARISLAGRLSDRFSVYGSLRWNDYEGPNNAWIVELDQDYEYHNIVNTTFNPRLVRETLSGMLELDYELDPFSITTVTSYTRTKPYNQHIDLDISPEFVLDLIRPEKFNVFTQELRFTSIGKGPFEWMLGLYYLDFAEEMDSELLVYESWDVLAAGGIPTAAQESNIVAVIPFEDRERDRTQYAAFANTSYRVGDFEIGAGARIDRWMARTLNRQSGLTGKQQRTEFLPRLSLSYFLDERGSNIYAAFTKGYEPGGFNLTNFAGSTDLFGFAPEEATNYEVGLRGALLNGRLVVTAAGFFVVYKDRQFELQTADPVTGDIVEGILNAGNSKQHGAELEVRWRVNEHLNLAVGGGFVDAKWDSGTILDNGMDISGLKPPFMQSSNAVFIADYDRPIGNGLRALARAQISHNGRFETDLGNQFYNPAYTLANVRVGVARANWELSVNVENIFNEKYFTDTTLWPNFNPLIAQPTHIIGTLGQPRLVTGSLRVRF